MPGAPIPIHVEPTEVRDDPPDDCKIQRAVLHLPNGRAAGASLMRAEDVKRWLRGILENEGTEGAGDDWRNFVALLQTGCTGRYLHR